MKKLVILLAISFGFLTIAPLTVSAQTPTPSSKQSVCEGVGFAGGNCDDPTTGTSVQKIITMVINILSYIVGVAAVIMIIIGGFKYITSGGDSSSINSAKNTILYAVIGLVVVALSQALVVFVLNKADQTLNPPASTHIHTSRWV